MTIKNIECADCGAPVPYGRLACPSCGALLVAVAGGPPPAVRVIETPSADAVDDRGTDATPMQKSRGKTAARTPAKEPVTREHAGKPAGGNGTARQPAPTAKAPAPAAAGKKAAAPAAARASAPPIETSSTSSAPVAAQLAYLVEPSPDAPNYVIPTPAQAVTPAAAVASAVAVESEPPGHAGNGRSRTIDDVVPPNGHTYLEPEPPIRGSSGYVIDDPYADAPEDAGVDSPWPPLLQPEPTIVARPYGGPSNGTSGAPRPGAYLPPNASIATGAATSSAGVTAQAATARGGTSAGPLPATRLAGGAAAGATVAVAVKGPTRFDPVSTISAAFAGIDRARIAEVAGWFVVAGSTVAMLGFLLPWSVVVIGSRGNGGYLDDWGLASPTHVFAVLGLAGVLALGVLQNPVPVWLRTGVLGLLTGGLLVGLTWPYAIGPLGAELGAMATFIGGLLLVGGGLVAIWATRHAEPDPVV
jgi:hypothetical protein